MVAMLLERWCMGGLCGGPEAAEMELRSARSRMFSAKSKPELPAFPFPLPVLMSRMARAPKLRRRPNGVAGTLDAGASLSSNGLSSTVPELELEMLPARGRMPGVKGELWLGEPDRPMVVSDKRRCWA